ncbi:hypothetical protein WPS_29760 [Vulcanimicrobium alpinum]|uniref:DUF4870 domain-containing protein n=1 Tax=Vulcanimicrobium alpinum TaxID=3016050 RepID=A0AAN1XYF8_UNVUL|nr:hypothetical protein [Vulcanimicrobium alpinum]BDE07700.1 hypothetical protein WPS_29760 [Vulcanimicrobium alpinum]
MIQDQSQSSFGLAPNVAAGIASFFTWLGGLIILLGKPPQQWVRFVAVQAIVMFVVYFAIIIGLNVVVGLLSALHLGILALILFPVEMILGLAYFVAWILMTVKAFQGQAMRLPFISTLADRWVSASTSL